MFSATRLLIFSSIAVYAAGCSCNQDYAFTKTEIPSYTAPQDLGSWLSMDVAPDGRRLVVAYYDREQTALGFAVGEPQEDGTVVWEHEHVDGYPDSEGMDTEDKGKFAS
ncbi:MAG: hypothetical protein HN348_36480, partial [Proteobacteria bacterium]|nr:hypothetical protein [Pseudomonadota bacterium]